MASIFERFWWILEGKLGSKIKQKLIQKGIKKAMENILDLEAIWERFGSQVGTENEAKMNTKRHAKNDAKMMGGWVRPRWGGVYPFPSLGNTRGLGPLVPLGVARTFCDFFAILIPFFFPMFFRCHFWSILARFCLPTWLPKSTNIDEKSMPRCLLMLTSFFNRFLIHFCSRLVTPKLVFPL